MRCIWCKKKSLITMECKCEQIYCLNCLPSFNHNCSFNYKEANQKLLAEKLIKVQKNKVTLI